VQPATASQQKELLLKLQTSPEDERAVFVVGNFNNWPVGDQQYELVKTGPGAYEISLSLTELPETLEYKYVRDGSWDYVELNDAQKERHNRKIKKEAGTITDRVHHWRSDGFSFNKALLPKIEVLSESFELPDLIRTRRIAALLPHDYYESDKRYPVLYLQDGQNLFDDYAPFGNWAVDKRLAFLAERGMGDVIIVAIDHAGDKRIVEFTPSSTKTKWGKGEGKKYARFLTKTLKPYVDQHFRTLPDWEHTGIGGSSMGGLISIYAGMMYPQVYGKLMIFSPSLWLTPNIPFQLLNISRPYSGRVYLYGGGKESATMVPNLQRLMKALNQYAADQKPVFELSVDPEGEHNEHRWGIEFPKAIKWLFFH